MEKQQILAALATRQAGQFFALSIRRPGKVRKGVSNEVYKRSVLTCQLARYGNRAPVREAVANGDREAPKLPPWVIKTETVDGVTFWQHKDGTQYLAAPVARTNPGQWELDGADVELDAIRALLLATELYERPTKDETEDKGQAQFVAVKLENIVSIG